MLSPSGIDALLGRLSGALEAAECEPFRQAALTALAAMPPETLGPGSAYRCVAAICRRYFRPPQYTDRVVGAGSRYGLDKAAG